MESWLSSAEKAPCRFIMLAFTDRSVLNKTSLPLLILHAIYLSVIQLQSSHSLKHS